MNNDTLFFFLPVFKTTKRSLTLNIMLFFGICFCNAQINNTHNSLILFQKNLALNNAALTDTLSTISAGNQSFIKDYNGIRSFYVCGDYLLPHSNNSKSYFGLTILNGQYGELINDVQYRGRYSYRLPINSSIEVAAGVEAGAVNINFESTRRTAGGSDSQFDINTMIAIFGTNWKTGISLNHLTNPIIQPINDQFEYARNLNWYLEYTHIINPDFSIIVAYQSIINSFNHRFRFNSTLLIYDQFEFGIGMKSGAYTTNAGIRSLEIGLFRLNIYGAYQVPFYEDGLLRYQVFQLHLDMTRNRNGNPFKITIPTKDTL